MLVVATEPNLYFYMINQQIYQYGNLFFLLWQCDTPLFETLSLWVNGKLIENPLLGCPIHENNKTKTYLLVTACDRPLNKTTLSYSLKNKKLKIVLQMEKKEIFPLKNLCSVIVDSNLSHKIHPLLEILPQYFPEISASVLFQLKQHLYVEQFSYSKSTYDWQLQLLFDEHFYLSQNPSHKFLDAPLKHYLEIGAFKNYNPNPLFHSTFYLEQYPNVKNAQINPLVHFIQHGHFENFKPNPLFNTGYYEKKYPQVRTNHYNPLVHYLYIGAFKHFKPNPLFDSEFYLKNNPQLIQSATSPLEDYLSNYKRAGKNPNPYFDNDFYAKHANEPDFKHISPLQHYYEYGLQNGLETSKNFDAKGYLRIYKDVKKDKINPLIHFIEYGQKEGRIPLPEKKFKQLKVAKLLSCINHQAFIPHPPHSPIDIIIPVFNQLKAIKKLFQSIFKNTTCEYNLIIVNDASNAKVKGYLNQLAAGHSNIKLLHNPANVGYVKSCNIAFSFVKHNMVLLNTDIVLPNQWLERLIRPLEKNPQIASVTPFSNSATLCSFPNMLDGNPMYLGLPVTEIDSVFKKLKDTHFNIPTAIGFCMAISKSALNRVGSFNEELFDKGYGEENDWSQRASLLGYKHVVAGNLFIEHKHGLVFSKTETKELLHKNKESLKALRPDYFSKVNQAILEDNSFYHKLLARLILLCGRQYQLEVIIDHNLGGGTTAYRKRLIGCLVKNNQTVILVHPTLPDKNKYHVSVLNKKDSIGIVISKFKKVIQLLLFLNIKKITLNSLVSYPNLANQLKLIGKLKKLNSCQLEILIHDYYSLCPSYNLINHKHLYCHLPSLAKCQRCYEKLNLTDKKIHRIDNWRKIWGNFMLEADTIVNFSLASQTLFSQIYPKLEEKIVINPHSMDYFKSQKINLNDSNKTLKIGVLGNINTAKGLDKLISLANYIIDCNKSHKILMIGNVSTSNELPTNIHITGSYDTNQLADIIEKNKLSVFFMPSIWPETFSYVIEELMLLEVPLVTYDLGAQGEKAKRYHKGKVIPLSASNAEIINALQTKN